MITGFEAPLRTETFVDYEGDTQTWEICKVKNDQGRDQWALLSVGYRMICGGTEAAVLEDLNATLDSIIEEWTAE